MKFVFPILFVPLLIHCSGGIDSSDPVAYPDTRKVDTVDNYFGTEVPDPYRWLEDDLSSDTKNWVAEQNAVTFGYFENIHFRAGLLERLEQLNDYERISAPFEEGNYIYFYKNDGLQDHSVLYRRPIDDPDATPEVYLDPNQFSQDGTIALAGVYFSKDGSLSAHLISDGGSDWRKLIVMNTEEKRVVEDTLLDLKFTNASWKGNDGFYYCRYDRPLTGSQLSARTERHKLFYHKLGTSQEHDRLIFGGEAQPYRYVGGDVTEDQRYLVITAANSTTGNKMFIRDLSDPGNPFIPVVTNEDNDHYLVHNEGSILYIHTNLGAPNNRLIRTDVNDPVPQNWMEVIPESEQPMSASSAGHKILATYLIDAYTTVKQYDLEGNHERDLELPGIGTAWGFGGKVDDEYIYYSYTSFTYPTSVFKYEIATGKTTLHVKPELDFNPDDYETSQIFYTSVDGTRVPMFIVHKSGLERDGENPTWLYGYGGFDISLRPGFSPSRILWLENGGVYAQPSLRGGGEYGEEWHLAGARFNKQSVFDDFIAAAEYLIENDFTSGEYLAIAGGSNGGLLVGASMTQRPDLFRVALPAVGVLDMLRYHKFTSGAGWVSDYGTSEESREMFEYLYHYSPLHNLEPEVEYPATLITTSDHDDRVVPAHSYKFAAQLQDCHSGNDPVLIRIETRSGHGSVSLSKALEVTADQYAFTFHNMGLEPSLPEMN